MKTRLVLVGFLLAGASACTGHAPAPLSGQGNWADECSALPGYPEFRARLEQVVAARDGAALRALFHPDGAMRVHGIGGRASTPDWGFSQPGAEEMWTDLGEILALGCVRRGDRLLLPAMAGLVEDGLIDPEFVLALQDVTIRRAPDPRAAAVGAARKGSRLQSVIHDEVPGWTQIRFRGRKAYAPTRQLRNPHSLQLVFVQHEGDWRIREFGSGV
jgi:hypothetical protein